MSDTNTLRHFLQRAGQRQFVLQLMEGMAAGVVCAALLLFGGVAGHGVHARALLLVAGLLLLGAVVRVVVARWHARPVAAQVEARAPQCRNVLITASELLDQETRADRHAGANAGPYLSSLVFQEASRLTGTLDLADLFPARRPALAVGVAAVLVVIALFRPAGGVHALLTGTTGAPDVASIGITLTPPSYAGQPTEQLHDPARVQALAGSRLHLTVKSNAAVVMLETLHGRERLKAEAPGVFAGDLLADADGYLALEAVDAAGTPGPRRLIGLSVTPDLAPQVQIVKPGEDMRLLDGHKTIDLVVTASDDIGLASLRLRFIRVSGSGENYTFTDGEVPLVISRTDARNWKATAKWRLDSLGLEAGDMVVYRAVAADHRPGSVPTESDSYIAEVLSPGSEAAGGFETDPEVERYALSQQMIILKTERLMASRDSMTVDSFADRTATLAMEQRSVRAEFVFMMGGEVASEVTDMTSLNEGAEAEGEGEMLAGHEKSQGRVALTNATRAMSRAAGALTDTNVVAALPLEREALKELEKAFSHSRILLRALTQQERLDLSRRLTGVLTDASRTVRPVPAPELDAPLRARRDLLARIATLTALPPDQAASREASAIAEAALRVDPASTVLHGVSDLLAKAATALAHGNRNDATPLIDQAATALAAEIRAGLPAAPAPLRSAEASRLGGALSEALRLGRGTP